MFENISGEGWAVIGAVTGSVIAGAVSILTTWQINQNGIRKQRADLEHATKSKTDERNMLMRKEVYFEAAEALAVTGYSLLSLAEGNLKDLDQQVKTKLAASMQRVHLVGHIRLIELFAECNSFCESQFLQLVPQRIAADAKQSMHDASLASHKLHLDRYTEINAKMETHFKSGTLSDQLVKLFEEEQAGLSVKMDAEMARASQLVETILNERLELIKACSLAYVEFQRRLSRLTVLIKEDLGQSFPDNFEYYKLIEKSCSELTGTIDKFFNVQMAGVTAQVLQKD